MALCSDYIVRQNDNSKETFTHKGIIDQTWGKNGWILAYFRDQDEVEGKKPIIEYEANILLRQPIRIQDSLHLAYSCSRLYFSCIQVYNTKYWSYYYYSLPWIDERPTGRLLTWLFSLFGGELTRCRRWPTRHAAVKIIDTQQISNFSVWCWKLLFN